MALIPILLSGLTARAQEQVTVTYTYSNLPVRIFPASADVVSVATIIVPRAIKMTKVAARVQILYPNSGDLKVYLYSPQLTQTILLEHDCSVQNIDTTFDDSASSLWKDTCPTEAGRGPFRPDQPLSRFNSDDSSFGVWQLAVQNDRSDSRSGWIREFSLTISGTAQASPITNAQTVLNVGSLSGGGTVAPGELLSIFGIGLGPSSGVSAAAGAWPTELGGTTVTIDGTPVPLTYSSLFEVQIQAQFNLTPGSTATLQVKFNNQSTSPVLLSIVNAAPGLYTKGAHGLGQVRAANQDGSANSRTQPAPRGSIVVFSASGLGAVNPPVAAGAVPPSNPLSTVAAGVAATIGGVPATVHFAGLAPGIPGVYQLNVEIPAGAASGTQEILIYSNGSSSQKGATIEVQ
jgi:uncharacterized protein (TIGR03437 family)